MAFKYEVIEIHPHQSYIRAMKLLKAVMTMLIHREWPRVAEPHVRK